MPKNKKIKLSVVAVSIATSLVVRAELDINALATADTTTQSIKTEENGTLSLTTLTIAPRKSEGNTRKVVTRLEIRTFP